MSIEVMKNEQLSSARLQPIMLAFRLDKIESGAVHLLIEVADNNGDTYIGRMPLVKVKKATELEAVERS